MIWKKKISFIESDKSNDDNLSAEKLTSEDNTDDVNDFYMINFLCESPTKSISRNIEKENDLRTSFSSK